ncbi:MAG: hypothetical protein AMXMBFR25_26460 [Lysobacterales bacterium]|nr:hypothetical protein [Xanthomonadales bacterium]
MSVLEQLLGQLGPDTIARMSAQLGASPQQTRNAIQAALPLMLGAMQRNAATPQGAQALHGALQRDHQGVDLGGLLGGLLGGGGGAGGLGAMFGSGSSGSSGLGELMGAVVGAMGGGDAPQPAVRRSPIDEGKAILGHVFGAQQSRATAGVARASGLDAGSADSLLAMLAPMLMGALGQASAQKGLDAGGLGELLGQLTGGLGGQRGGGLQQVLGKVLDKDGDGDVDAQDLLTAGSSIFGSLMQR